MIKVSVMYKNGNSEILELTAEQRSKPLNTMVNAKEVKRLAIFTS